MLKLDHASMSDIIDALADGRITATALTQAYLARIAAYDRDGPSAQFRARAQSRRARDRAKARRGEADPRLPLAGIPILVKDNIATGDKQHTTAGSLALAGARARRDATVVTQLRRAGAVILGKTNLTEFANILAIDMPSGYSSLGGQVRIPMRRTLNESGHPARAAGRIQFGFGGRRCGGTVRGLDRHRDLGLAAVARQRRTDSSR